MGPIVRRKFTLVDAMVLIAGTGVALFWIRYDMLRYDFRFLVSWEFLTRPLALVLAVGSLVAIFVPFILPLSVALVALRLRSPRPKILRVFRQPGTAACIAIVCVTILTLITNCVAPSCFVASIAGRRAELASFVWSSIENSEAEAPMLWGTAVVVAWVTLWLSRGWRAEPSWIDRAGRALGVACLIASVLYGFASGPY
jgi:hypothetical protein